MRHKAPSPLNARTEVITDGYQLCARCGQPLLNGEPSIVVERSPTWRIYTHPEGPSCPAKAVKGWLAVRRAAGIRDSPNVETPREAEPIELNGSLRASVCILDDKHIEAELDSVDYASREIPMNIGWQAVLPNITEDDLIAWVDTARLSSLEQPGPANISSGQTHAAREQLSDWLVRRLAKSDAQDLQSGYRARKQRFRTDSQLWGDVRPKLPTWRRRRQGKMKDANAGHDPIEVRPPH
jgi:hypothetical protein